jgi:hypothetical protein
LIGIGIGRGRHPGPNLSKIHRTFVGREDLMNARRLFTHLLVSAAVLLASSPALALANRVFLSARSGNDVNSCDNIATPDRTLAGAVVQLNPDGEVIVLDSGGYGPVTLTKGITIEAPAGVTAFIHPPSGDAITINAGSANVTLRGLVLNQGTSGISITSVGALSVERCVVTGVSDGIAVPFTGSLAGTRVMVLDSAIMNRGVRGINALTFVSSTWSGRGSRATRSAWR